MERRKHFLLIISFFGFFNCYAQDGNYAVNKIPAQLLVNSNVVKRFEELRFEVIDIGKARLYHKYVITILNEKGNGHANLHMEYDKLHSIESIEGRLYDESGKKIKTLKKGDIQDLSGTSEMSLAEDNRIKQFSFYHKSYPYTVEYETEVKYNHTLFYPWWVPQEDENYAVEYSRISVSCPQGIDFRFKAYNYPGQQVITTEKNNKVSTWEIKNLASIEEEYAAPHWLEITPAVCMGPVQFQMENYVGNMSTWQDFGKFVYALKNGRDQLPDNIKQTVHSLTDGITDTKKKIEILYDFFQKNTRYISIQLGIGGWQPFDAKNVAANRYGDCKALSNYMYSLLKEAGVRSFYTLVKADARNFFIKDFPFSQFNHVILCVPVQKDTVWLECTSQTSPAGYLGHMTAQRPALLIDENGGTIVQTPKYGLKENLQLRNTLASIDEEGNLTANIITDYKALQQDRLHGIINNYSKDNVMEYLKSEIDLPNYDVVKFDYKEQRSALPVITETLNITDKNYAQVSGSRLFINPNIISKTHHKIIANSERKFEVVLSLEYRDVDTVQIIIPVGYQAESVPEPQNIKTRFGTYTSSVKLSGEKIIYYRSMEEYEGRFPSGAYNDLVKFYDQVYKADRNKVVFVKK